MSFVRHLHPVEGESLVDDGDGGRGELHRDAACVRIASQYRRDRHGRVEKFVATMAMMMTVVVVGIVRFQRGERVGVREPRGWWGGNNGREAREGGIR